MGQQAVQANIAGYNGRSSTVLSVYDSSTDFLLIQKEVPWKHTRVLDECAVVSDDASFEFRDMLFLDDMIRDSIDYYYEMKNGEKIEFSESATRCMPGSAIAFDKVSERGKEYRINPDINNAQMGILATIAFIKNQSGINTSLSMFDEIREINNSFTPFTI